MSSYGKKSLADFAAGLSYAEIARATNEVLKDALIEDRDVVDEAEIRNMLAERKGVAVRLGETHG